MLAILKRMNTADEFEIVFFGDEVPPHPLESLVSVMHAESLLLML